MIEIVRNDPKSDARPQDGAVDPMVLQRATADHIQAVEDSLTFFANMLKKAGKKHDHTKTENMEEFQKALESGKIKKSKWYKMHVTEERHHLFENPPEDINLVDVLENICDCVMAGLVRGGENGVNDITLPNELLQKAHKNTVDLLMKNVEVTDKGGKDK